MPVSLPSSDFLQHLGKLEGMQKKSADINMATVPSVTYLLRKYYQCNANNNVKNLMTHLTLDQHSKKQLPQSPT